MKCYLNLGSNDIQILLTNIHIVLVFFSILSDLLEITVCVFFGFGNTLIPA